LVALSRRTWSHRPTTTRSSSSPDCVPSAVVLGSIPAASSRSDTSSQRSAASTAQSIRTGKRFPSEPWRNGSGNDPTTAGTRIATLQSRWSHHTRSPPETSRSAAPTSSSMPFT
jgi:hypothetical protein